MRNCRAGVVSGTKITGLVRLAKIIAGLKRQGRCVVFTNGCFDILHYGHVQYLEKARALGDLLVVAINTDASVRRLKGKKRPIVCQHDRAGIVAGLESVDYVVLFSQDTPIEVIQRLKPDVLVKGGDWKANDIVGSDFVRGLGGRTATIRLAEGRSTTGLIKTIAQKFGSGK